MIDNQIVVDNHNNNVEHNVKTLMNKFKKIGN
jgi:hypothetical protein